MSRLNNSSELQRRAIIVADDFGRSSSINRAVIEAHRKGVLSCASLMVGGAAWEEAAELARENPELGVGLHVTLACGFSALPPGVISNLADRDGKLDSSPVRAGLRAFFDREVRADLEREIEAQFARFRGTGLSLDHVNGHLNMHLHPSVLTAVLTRAAALGCRYVRLTRDPLFENLRLASGRLPYRLSHAAVFGCLSCLARGDLEAGGFRHADRVFGLLQSGDMNTGFVGSLLRELPTGISEIYFHPDLKDGRGNADYQALVSDEVRQALAAGSIRRIRCGEMQV